MQGRDGVATVGVAGRAKAEAGVEAVISSTATDKAAF